jgi:hypothetical protein
MNQSKNPRKSTAMVRDTQIEEWYGYRSESKAINEACVTKGKGQLNVAEHAEGRPKGAKSRIG